MIAISAVTPDRWPDLRTLFGDSGAYSGCWCTWWRLPAKQWSSMASAEREQLLRAAVECGDEPGLLAYQDGQPVGWIAVSPRSQLPRLERSPHLRPIDDLEVWAVSCFWIARGHRHAGVATALLAAAVDHARERGAEAVEGYPVDPAVRAVTASEAFTGSLPMFVQAGFLEVARRSPTARVVVRKMLR